MNRRRKWIVAAVVVTAAIVAAAASGWLPVGRALPPGPFRIGYVHDPPYMFTAPDGKARGLSVDVLREAGRRAGIAFEWVRVDPALNADTALGSGEVALWPGLTILPHRRPAIFFTEPWLRTDVYVVVYGDGGRPDASFAGTMGITPLPVMEHFAATVSPRANLVRLPDGAALLEALCAGKLDAAFVSANDLVEATAPHGTCKGADVRPHTLANSTLELAVASRPSSKDVALALRSQIDGMASDGTIKTIVFPYSFYAATEILAVYENLQNRAQRRLFTYGIVGLSAALIGALALSTALYRAQRAARRSLEERDALEVKLRSGQRLEAVGQLAGGVAHDFNNLITVILGNCEMARTHTTGPAVKEALSEIHSAGERAADLVRQLLAFSRRQVVVPRVLSLHDELRQVQPMLRRLVPEHIGIRLELGAGQDHVCMDPGQLSQVLLNVTVNARDAMPDGGTLTFSTGTLGPGGDGAGMVRLGIEDSGTGMPPEVQARAFEPFFSTKSPGKGTGLGLSTAYGIVAQAGGSMEIRSEVDRGTLVEILLPLATGPVEPGASLPPPSRPRVQGTILVVEDQDDVRRLVRQVLGKAGYEVVEAHDGVEGLEVLRSQASSIGLVLTDLVMPRMSGTAMHDAARASGLGTPFVFVSGYSEEQLAVDTRADIPLLQKPFTPAALLEAIETAWNSRTPDPDSRT
jgi:signal transduction histidine kinase/CheY-like chemotaxis protein